MPASPLRSGGSHDSLPRPGLAVTPPPPAVRASKLKETANRAVDFHGRLGYTHDRLRRLPGVGSETIAQETDDG